MNAKTHQKIVRPLTTLLWLAIMSSLLAAAETPMNEKQTTSDSTNRTELATFGGGCFWCMEAVFERLDGVRSVASGYAGGTNDAPTYKLVSLGDTGHAEAIQIEFDPARIRYADLLDVFWVAHDPTTLNRQGGDIGTQYRSAIFYHTDAQKLVAEKSKQAAAKNFKDPVVTEIAPFQKFYRAEEYHQGFYRNNPNYGYCQVVIRPKLEKLEQKLKKKH